MIANRPAGDEGSPEWIVSYADMVTILMAFFVILYSMAGAQDKPQQEAMMRSLRLNLGPLKSMLAPVVSKNSKFAATVSAPQGGEAGGSSRDAGPARVARVDPGDPSAAGGMLDFEGDTLDLSGDNEQLLAALARLLAGKGQTIEVRGHASRRPLADGAPYRDAWELAFARCRKTMELLASAGIERTRMRLCVSPLPPQTFAGEDAAAALRDARVEVFMLEEFSELSGDRGPRPTGRGAKE
jgi:chemotaxis protein MotB